MASQAIAGGVSAYIAIFEGNPTKEHSVSEASNIAVFEKVETDSWGDRYIYFKGISAGTTNINVSDGVNNHKVTVTVLPLPEFELNFANEEIELEIEEVSSGTYVKGSGIFEISAANPDLVTISEATNNGTGDVFYFDVTGKKAGTTTITVKDKITGKSGTLNVTVAGE
ncbi:hypothetical protein CAPN002_21540 [Capnocytophaga stomatis]|uniref:hypothetical protein n=1 Tax=Capnocytophaga stomatis TaxID=1848904 RepID=UPI001951D23A|nr:hypothetical protein [Capnocytophaga stomatis]GIJ94936.1 hypothetical protein CAPN002_21540 [Capnocytophaga stomatis]